MGKDCPNDSLFAVILTAMISATSNDLSAIAYYQQLEVEKAS